LIQLKSDYKFKEKQPLGLFLNIKDLLEPSPRYHLKKEPELFIMVYQQVYKDKSYLLVFVLASIFP